MKGFKVPKEWGQSKARQIKARFFSLLQLLSVIPPAAVAASPLAPAAAGASYPIKVWGLGVRRRYCSVLWVVWGEL